MTRLSRKQKLNQGNLFIRGCALAAAFGLAACGGSGGGGGGGGGGNTATGTILGVTFTPLSAFFSQTLGGGYGSSPAVVMANVASACSAYEDGGSLGGDIKFNWYNLAPGIPPVGGYEVSNSQFQQNGIDVDFTGASGDVFPQSGTVTVTSSSASLVEGTFNLTYQDNTGLTTNLSGSFSAPSCP